MSQDDAGMPRPRTVFRQSTPLSEWTSLETISVASAESPEKVGIYHAFQQADYVHILPMTATGSLVLVRQYRPVIECWTLELPGGLRDPGEGPEVTAARELREETGFAVLDLVPIIECYADVGRLSNRFYGFFAIAERVAEPELGIQPILLSGKELKTHALEGRLSAMHDIGLIYLSAMHPDVAELCRKHSYAPVPWK